MSAKHRKASKLAAKRTAIAATAIGATAGVGLMGAPAQAAAPDYTQAISDYSHALNNFLNASNNVQNSAGSVWNPIASGTNGVLPVFGSSYKLSDATKITDLPDILINLGKLNLPTGVPGVVPNVVLPGGSQLDLSTILPTSMPGGAVLVGAGNTLNQILALPIVGDIADTLPPVSDLITGLEISQAKYTSGYNWGLLGLNGRTNVLNTFVQTPSGLILNLSAVPGLGGVLGGLGGILGTDLSKLQIVPNGSLPQGTIWVPQGDGTYNFPLGGQLGWWAAAPTAVLKLPATLGGSQTVLSVPIGAAGVQLPLNLAKAGVLSGTVLLPTQNGVYSPIGLTMTNVNTILPIGLTNINVTTGNYIGTNGINVNNGQNLMLIQNPLGIPLPVLYGLGGFNVGVEGAGLTSPSLFGIKLFSDDLLQVGTKTGPNTNAGLIPPDFLPGDPLSQITTGLLAPLGADSLTSLLGLNAVIKPVMTAFGPVYQVFSSVALQPLSDLATQQYGPMVNTTASSILDLSQQAVDQSKNLPGADAQQPVPAAQQASTPATGPLALRSTSVPSAAPTAPEATSDVGGNGDQSPAPAGATSGNGGVPDAGEGKHRTGTPVKDIAERITGGLDSLGDKITAGADKNSDKVTGGTDKSTEAAAVPETKTDVTAPEKDEAPATANEEKTEAADSADAA